MRTLPRYLARALPLKHEPRISISDGWISRSYKTIRLLSRQGCAKIHPITANVLGKSEQGLTGCFSDP